MSSPKDARAQLLSSFGMAHRRHVADIVIFNQALAEQLGLNATDLQCLNLLDLLGAAGAMTAGQLTEIAGISTGAMTRLIDRLEAVGYVRRERPPEDRRRVIVRTVPENCRKVGQLYDAVRRQWQALMTGYTDA